MKKSISVLAALVLCFVLLGGCRGREKLADGYDPEELKKSAKEVIELVNEGDYLTLADTWWSAQMKTLMPADKLETDVGPIVEELGAFEAFDKEAVTGSTDKDTDQNFGVAIIKVKYENRNAQYTISFNKDMKVAGFYIK